MLFNSPEFILLFLPVTLLGFFVLGRMSRHHALGWLIVASLFFYACWRPINVLIIAPSIVVNFLLARALLRLAPDAARARFATALLVLGIVFNVLFLGYFKYVNFVAIAINDVAGTNFVLRNVILPLGISFITFQKIAFLIDVRAGRVKAFSLREYCLFVLFFPQLIAGPIVHFREMMPQFQQTSARFNADDVSVGVTLFLMGLFKKVVLADGIALHVAPLYAAVASGGQVELLDAWIAAIGFTLQIYFDFSGYTDMALGAARCFGIKLPPNFDSPLKATSIIDFWLRWHMTLTRFLTAYIYNPMVLERTRRRMAKGLPGVGGRNRRAGEANRSIGGFVELLAGPTLVTMLVSGIWHGAGYTFLLWGLLHGLYLVINHAWRTFGARRWPDKERYEKVMGPLGWMLTFVAVAISMVLFRSPTVATAGSILRGMTGWNGASLPNPESVVAMAWIVALSAIALALPNSLELIARREPALTFKRPWAELLAQRLQWQPSLAWSAAIAVVAAAAVSRLGGASEFLYWQF